MTTAIDLFAGLEHPDTQHVCQDLHQALGAGAGR